jgi:hypothetical protein
MWTKIYQQKKEYYFWLYGIIDGNLIGYKLRNNETIPVASEMYQTYKVFPKITLNHLNTHDV